MPTKLSIYNGALRHLGQRRLASLDENNTTRRELDEAWDSAVKTCLNEGYWNWAMRTIELPADNEMEPQFGYTNVFLKPDDWVRTWQISTGEAFQPPLENFVDETDYWYADADPLYIRYVSDSDEFGFNVGLWPVAFSNYVEGYLAQAVCRTITGAKPEDMEKSVKKLLYNARAKDAMNEGVGIRPLGSWASSRSSSDYNNSRWNKRFI
jgi:hypothetical protein